MSGQLLRELTQALRSFDARAFTEKHGGHKESQSPRSSEYLLNCPMCGGDNLRWNPLRGDMGGWVCWNCRQSGNTLRLVQVMERCDSEDAIDHVMGEYVGGGAQLDLSEIVRLPEVRISSKPRSLDHLPRIHLPPYCEDARMVPRVRAYLHGRGINDAMIVEWGILAGTRGRTKDYAVFPVVMDGGIAYWQCRASWDPPANLNKEQRKAWIKATKYRKTLNPFNPPVGIRQATAGEVLYNYDRAKTRQHVVIVEGPVDTIQIGDHGIGLLGKGTDDKIERLRRMGARRFTIYLDRGEEERAKAQEIASRLEGWAELFFAEPPRGHDAGSLTREQNAHVVNAGIPVKDLGLRSNLVP